MVEIIGWRGGFDAVWFDQEHAGLTMAQMEEAARAARGVGLDCFVRLNATDYATVMRALEAGAGGVMASMVKSARQAEEIVSWAKFHPRGCRGVNGTGVDGRYGAMPGSEYFRRANAETVVAVQIEHIDAVDGRGAHRRRTGPGFPLYRPGRPEPVDGDSRRVGASSDVGGGGADGAGGGGEPLAWAILPRDAAHARRCVELGCRMLSIGMDAWAFQKGVAAVQDDFAEFFRG